MDNKPEKIVITPEYIKDLKERAKTDDTAKLQLTALVENMLMAKSPKIRAKPKIGRNQPCTCSSGKKYKKCCLSNED